MRKFFSTILIGAALFLPMTAALAAEVPNTLGGAQQRLDNAIGGGANGTGTNVGLNRDLSKTISLVVTAVLSLVGTVFLVLTIYAGILWMTAQGKDEQIEKAGSIIKATIIGLFITLGAYAITYFVAGRLSGQAGIGSTNTQQVIDDPVCANNTVNGKFGSCQTTCAAGATIVTRDTDCKTAGKGCCIQ